MLQPAQQRTLEAGSFVVLGGLGFGFQVGNWPAWTIAAGIGMYALWVILYAEITIQRTRHPAYWQRWRWQGRRRWRGRPAVEPTSASMPQPVQEQPAP
jgi:hypothetical protein